MSKVSAIIPSRTELFLSQTVDDVFKKATGEIEVIVVLEGYWPEPPLQERPGLILIHHDQPMGLRKSINHGTDVATGEYIMKLDAHCLMAEGWDETLKADCDTDWIVIPRRYSLEPDGWKIREGRPTIDYEYISFPYLDELTSVRLGNKWYKRATDRKDILIDDNMSFQGSCWFIHRNYLINQIGPLDTVNYGRLNFILESEELGNKCWLSGGQVKINKKTWYAHLHKGKQYGRMYFIDKRDFRPGRKHHIKYWMHNLWPQQTRKFEWLVEHFWPVPTWPEDWKDEKYETEYLKLHP